MSRLHPPLVRPPPPSGFGNPIGDNFCYFNSVLQMILRCHRLMYGLITVYDTYTSEDKCDARDPLHYRSSAERSTGCGLSVSHSVNHSPSEDILNSGDKVAEDGNEMFRSNTGLSVDDLKLLQKLENYFDHLDKKKAIKGDKIDIDEEPCLLVGNHLNIQQGISGNNDIQFPAEATETALQILFFKTCVLTAKRFYANYCRSDNNVLISSVNRRENSTVCAKELRIVVAAMERSYSRGSMNDAPEFYEFFMHSLAAGISSFNRDKCKMKHYDDSKDNNNGSSAGLLFYSNPLINGHAATEATLTTNTQLKDNDCGTIEMYVTQWYTVTLEDSWMCHERNENNGSEEEHMYNGVPQRTDKQKDQPNKGKKSCRLLNKLCTTSRQQVIHRAIVHDMLVSFNDHKKREDIVVSSSSVYKSFSEYISEGQKLASKESRNCPSCGDPVEVNIEYTGLPKGQFVIHLLWSSVRPKRSDVTSLMLNIIEDTLYFPRALNIKQTVDSSIHLSSAYLTSILLFKCSHYVAAVRLWDNSCHGDIIEDIPNANPNGIISQKKVSPHRHQEGHWYIIEDDRSPVYLGTEWSSLVRHVLIRGFSPLLLGYEVVTDNVAENKSHMDDALSIVALEKCSPELKCSELKRPNTVSCYNDSPVGVNTYRGVQPSARPIVSDDEIRVFLGRITKTPMSNCSSPYYQPLSLSDIIAKYNLTNTQSNSLKTVISVVGSPTYDGNTAPSLQAPPSDRLDSTISVTTFFPFDIYRVLTKFRWSVYEAVNWLLNRNPPVVPLSRELSSPTKRNITADNNNNNSNVSDQNTARNYYERPVLSRTAPVSSITTDRPFNLRNTTHLLSTYSTPLGRGTGLDGMTSTTSIKSPSTVKRGCYLGDPCKQLPTDLLDELDNQPISKCLRTSYDASSASVRDVSFRLSTVSSSAMKRNPQTLLGDTFLVIGNTYEETTTTVTFIRDHGGSVVSKRGSSQQYYVLVSLAYLKKRATVALKKMTTDTVLECKEMKCKERTFIVNIFNPAILECVAKLALYPILCLEKWIRDYMTRGTSNVWQVTVRKARISPSPHWADILTALSALASQSLLSSYDVNTVVCALQKILQCDISS